MDFTHFWRRFRGSGQLIKEYNGKLNSSESEQFALDEECVRIRDALAHGRLIAPTKDFPWRLWKFGRVKSGRVPIEYNEELTVDWLDKTWKMIDQHEQTVDACSKQRGYSAPPAPHSLSVRQECN